MDARNTPSSDQQRLIRRGRRVVVIGGSAGAHTALLAICRALPAGFSAPVLVTIHMNSRVPSRLAQILANAGPLPVADSRHGEPLIPGRIYVAPSDHHLLVGAERRAELSQCPPEHGFRPSIDALFRSAAEAYGADTVAVLLSGALADGVAGLDNVHRIGGSIIIQDPKDAGLRFLPMAALEAHGADSVLPAAHIAAALCLLIGNDRGA